MYINFQKQNRKEKEEEENNNRPINILQGNNILHILHVHQLTLNFIIHNNWRASEASEPQVCSIENRDI